MLAPWLSDQTEHCDRAGLERRAGRRLSDEDLAYMAQTGAIEASGDGYRVHPAMLGHAIELLMLPVPPDVLHASAALIDEHATAVADGLAEVFVESIWGPYRRGELDHEQVVAMLTRMRPMAVQGLVSAFGRAADRAARRGLEPRSGSEFDRQLGGNSPIASGTQGRCVQSLVTSVSVGLTDAHSGQRLGDRVRDRAQRRLGV